MQNLAISTYYIEKNEVKKMALRLRLQRKGRTNHPFYHLVVCDSRSPRDGRYVERLGYYDPTKEPSIIEFKADRVLHWYKNGARPSDSVISLFKAKKFDPKKKSARTTNIASTTNSTSTSSTTGSIGE